MHHPDQPTAPPAPQTGAATSKWRRRALTAGWVAVIATVILTGLLTGLIGVIKVQAAVFPLNTEIREGCLRDPTAVDPQTPCPKEAEAILHYPNGHTQVIRGTPQQVQRRMDRAVDEVVAAERWRGVGYLVVATLLVGSGIAASAWVVVRRRQLRSSHSAQPGRHGANSPAG